VAQCATSATTANAVRDLLCVIPMIGASMS
jgi:hypothetical protein